MLSIGRRHLTARLAALGLAAVGLLQVSKAQPALSEEEAVAKRLDAFRAAPHGSSLRELQ
jgi:hypothetical protein